MRRDDIERAIEDEEQTLTLAVGLLRSRAPWRRWPVRVRRALELALDEPTTPETSAWQARVLRRHLFGPEAWDSPLPVPPRASWIEIRRAERLRVDLPRLVPLRAGTYLMNGGEARPDTARAGRAPGRASAAALPQRASARARPQGVRSTQRPGGR